MSERILPADSYDALELSAFAFKGVGTEVFRYDMNGNPTDPVCAFGHASFATAERHFTMRDNPIARALHGAGINGGMSDDAVIAIRRRRKIRGNDTRIPFKSWCKELNIVRGD